MLEQSQPVWSARLFHDHAIYPGYFVISCYYSYQVVIIGYFHFPATEKVDSMLSKVSQHLVTHFQQFPVDLDRFPQHCIELQQHNDQEIIDIILTNDE